MSLFLVFLVIVLALLWVLWAQPPSIGTLTKMIIGTSVQPSAAYEYISFGLGMRGTVLSTDGIRGTRSHPYQRTRNGLYDVGGTIMMQPGPTDINGLVRLAMGQEATGSGTSGSPFSWSVNDKVNSYTGYSAAAGAIATGSPAIPNSFVVGIDRIAQAHAYYGCQVDRATFRCVQGGILEMEFDIVGIWEYIGSQSTVLGSGFAALVPSLQTPYVLMDATLTDGGTSYQFRQVEITINNSVKRDRYMNAIYRTDVPALDRTVSVTLSLPYTTDEIPTLYNTGNTPTAIVVTFATATNQLQMTMADVQFPLIPPETPGREEILLPLQGIARNNPGTTTSEIVITNY